MVQKEDAGEAHSLQGSAGGGSNSSMMHHMPRGNVMESWLMLEFCDIGTLSVPPPPPRGVP